MGLTVDVRRYDQERADDGGVVLARRPRSQRFSATEPKCCELTRFFLH